ncbi:MULTISPECIES: hypothetical protein [unclassified Calothrix]|nr:MULTISPECIES: hypothetical protein [unclassified Calothrix]
MLNANAWQGCKLVKRSQLKPIFLEVILAILKMIPQVSHQKN